MEKNELQQLFDAKRTQQENQRRQKEIASLIGHRKLVWPWWAVSATAAVIAAVVLTVPLHSPQEAPLVALQTEDVEPIIENIDTTIVKPIHRSVPRKDNIDYNIIETVEENEVIQEPVVAVPAIVDPQAEEPKKRVHTRRSSRLTDIKKAHEQPKAIPLIAHYLNVPDSILYSSNIVINL